MLKVLIADDEEKICQLIIKLINWEEMGLKIAATASNGIEALEQAKICKPEILITDIRMPGIDGMELIRKVKEKLPDTEIIIISGYRHFEYAQTAIRYGVRNYLLKPIKKEELRDTLQKIADIYREKNEQLNFEERVRLALKNDAGKLRTSFISRMIYGDRERENIISLKELNNQYHFHFREGVFQVAAIKFDHVNHNDSCISFLADKAAGLALQINWEEMGLKIAATASNGIEALEQAKICKPEILITDIRMPGIDGMELIRKVKEKLPDTEIIIISGYRHFEYAQTAIRYGVRNYLLKPIKKEELRDTLQKIADIYREKNEQLNFEERVRLALKNDAGKLRTSFISRMIYGDRERENIISLKELNNQYHFHFREGVFQVAAIKFDHVNHNDSCISFLADKAAGLALQYLEPVCFDHEVYAEFSTFYLLLNFGEEESKNVRRNVRQMLDELKAQESILNGMSVTIGMGSMVNTAGSIRKSFLDAVFMIKQRLLLGTGRMLEMDEAQQRKNSDFINSEAFYRFNREMERAVEALNVVETRRTIEGLRDVLKNYPGITGYEILQMTKEACNHYLFCMKSRGIRVDSEAKFVEEFSKDAGECADIEELFRLLGGTIGRSLQKASEAKKAEDNRPIRQAKQYIEENYSRSLTLEEVSEMAGFAPGYFSTLFKKETGVTFLEFLQSVRMDAAKKLLVSGNEGMNVICEKVGYADVKYFTKCFIKYTGLKPGEYRKIYS